jgi:hypothetical protein
MERVVKLYAIGRSVNMGCFRWSIAINRQAMQIRHIKQHTRNYYSQVLIIDLGSIPIPR